MGAAPTTASHPTLEWLAGGGEMGERIRALDWSRTPLGPVDGWPQSLRSAVSILLPSKAQICLFWGPPLIKLYNDAYIPVLATKHPGALGTPAHEVWAEIWDVLGPLLRGVVATGEAFRAGDHPFYLQRRGFIEETYFDVSYDPVRDESGKVGGVFCIVSETTGRVLGERRLRTLRDLGRAREARSPDEACRLAVVALEADRPDLPFAALYLLDRAGDVARCAGAAGVAEGGAAAPAAVRLADAPWPLAAACERGAAVTVPDLAAPVRDQLPAAAAPDRVTVHPIVAAGRCAGFMIAGASRFLPLDADYRDYFELVASHVGAAVAQAASYEAERRRAEALAELDRAKTAFFSNVSHEFRTPLTLVLGPLGEALAEPALPSEARRLLGLAQRNGQRLLKLVNTLLDFSRIEAGRVQAVFEPVDLAACTAELASVFRAAIEKAGLRLHVDCPPLPEPVYVDRDMWEKIVLNLLSNAFKYTPAGEIAVTLRAAGGRAVLAVRDTGVGIPAAELPRIFDRFHRVEGARGRTQEGTGIGLALVQELARLHGGTASATSAEDAGSTFTVALPLGRAHLPAERVGGPRALRSTTLGAAPFVEEALRWLPDGAAGEPGDLVPVARPVAAPADAPRPRVVLADDNADMREYIRRLLAPQYDVVPVADGEAALRAVAEHRPDLVVADVMMPRRDGFSLLREIRQTPESRTTAVILLSARAGEESRLEGLASGADDYLVKPFSARELLARVEAHVRLKRLRERAEEERQALLAREQAARQEAARTSELVETITRIAGRLAAQTDLGTLLQSFTDEATRLAGAQVGAFFHNAVDHRGPAYRVAALSGAPREAFDGLPPPRATRLFRPTFRGERIVRLDDVTESPDYGETPPHRGVPDGHLPVRSYLAVPVVSRTGEVFGAFFLGHERPRVFPERLEPIMAGIAAQLAIAVENVRLLDREQRARAAAEAASRAKDEFLAVLSHELRTPLNAVYGWAGLLQSGRLDAAATARALAAIMRNAHAQVQLIDDMLDVSRIVTGKMRLLSRPVDVTAVAEAALDAVRPAADARGLELHAALPARGVQVRGDPDRLQQVVWNLLSNAVKFTPAGGRVELSVRRAGGQLEIAVGDTGQGIAPDVLPHVFERFQQADSTPSRRHGGLGLGLALVRHLVELHGGQVAAASAGPGRGATFTVTLPLLAGPAAEAPPPPRAAAPPPAPPPAGGPSLSGVRVLVVDDDADGLELVTAILVHAGAETRSCRSMSAAMATLDAWRPDVVISDIEMPGEDGYALVRALRALPAERGGRTPAVALTAYGRMEDRLRALSAGYSRHVAKPVDPAELLTLVASLAGR